MEAKRQLIEFHYRRGLSNIDIFKAVKPHGINSMMVWRVVKRLKETRSTNDRPRSGRPRSIRTADRIKRIREKIRRIPERSARKLAQEEGINRESMRTILHVDLGLRAYRKRKIHGLTNAQKLKRLDRSKKLLKRHAGRNLDKIIFSDEKLFVMQQAHNSKNDVVYSLSIEAIPDEFRNVHRFQNKSSVMVWAALSKKGKIPIVFIDKGIKINGKYYREQVLEEHMVPGAKKLYPNGGWTFQQDSAPSHSANATQEWLNEFSPGFITKDEWPPSSPDLNPLDYSIWGILERKVNAKQHRSLESMQAAIEREWKKLSKDVICATIDAWPWRLKAVINRGGDRFE